MPTLKLSWHPDHEDPTVLAPDVDGTKWFQIGVDLEMLENVHPSYRLFESLARTLGAQFDRDPSMRGGE